MFFRVIIGFFFFAQYIYGDYLIFENSKYTVTSETDVESTLEKRSVRNNMQTIYEIQKHILQADFESDAKEKVKMAVLFDSVTISYNTYGWSFQFEKGSNLVKYFRINERRYENVEGETEINNSDEAIKIAKTFLFLFLKYYDKGNELSDYDSVNVKQIDNVYRIKVIGKPKNYIFDSRQVEMDIDTKNGTVLRYRGNIKSKYDMSYRPKITKDQVLKLVKEDMKKTSVDKYSIGNVYVVYEGFGWPKRWMWDIRIIEERKTEFGLKKYYIDSEDGSILIRPFELAE